MNAIKSIELNDSHRRTLATALKASGLTQGQLAEATEVARPMIVQVLGGRKQPSPELLRRIAKALKLTFRAEFTLKPKGKKKS